MNLNKADNFIPVIAKTSLDMPPLWGRLLTVSATEADLLSHFEIPAGRIIAVSFELGRGSFEDVRARIRKALRDGDGYYNYELEFIDPAQRALLAAAVIEAAPPIKI